MSKNACIFGNELSGADYFFLGLDAATRRSGLPPLVCALALDLRGRLDAARLREAIEQDDLKPWLAPGVRWRRRPWPWSLPRWQADAQTDVIIEEHVTRASASDWSQAEGCAAAKGSLKQLAGFAASLRRGARDLSPKSLGPRFVLLYDDVRDTTRLVFQWHHGLIDARGAVLILARLGNNTEALPRSATQPFSGALILDEHSANGTQGRDGFGIQLQAARELGDRMQAACRLPMLAFSRVRGTDVKFRFIDFSAAETARLDALCRQAGAGLQPSLFTLSGVMQAFERLRRERDMPEAACVVHVPQDLRRRGAPGPLLSNRLSFMLFRVEPESLMGTEETVAALKVQMVDQMRQCGGHDLARGLDALRRVPLGACARTLVSPGAGQVATCCFSDTGDTSAHLASFLGLEVADVHQLPPLPYPPGIQVAVSRFAGAQRICLAWAEGALSDEDAAFVEDVLRMEVPDVRQRVLPT